MENKAEQYFPTYNSKERDILLLEFEEANKIANSQTKIYGQMASLLIALITIIITLFLNIENENSKYSSQILKEYASTISVILFVFGAFLLRYFVDLQKQITINARKVVTLRVMLGLDYGSIQLTLPNWRVEGATNPFSIKYFTGWFTFRSSPFWVLLIGINTIWWFSIKNESPLFLIGNLYFHLGWGHLFISIIYLYLFRTNLNDRHETNWLNIKKFIATNILGVKLVPNFEYVLYRAKLSFIELDRLRVDYSKMKDILIQVEDKNFLKNKGVSYKSLFRGILSQFKFFRKKYGYIKSGGSTITMQLARSLFIPTTSDKTSRKIVEILLAYWINKQFSKDEIFKLYITSVQYEKRILGLANAIKYFFSDKIIDRKISNEEAFFLIERLSNNSSTVNWKRIEYLLSKVSQKIDHDLVKAIYRNLITDKKLRDL